MPLIDLSSSALIVIDAQHCFYGADRHDVDRERLSEVITRVAWVGGVGRALDVPTIITEEDAARNGGTDPRIVAQLSPGTPTFAKHAFSAVDNADIIAAIEATAKDTVVLVGLETDICVAQTALRLQDHGKRVFVVHDAVFSPGQSHANGLARMERAGIELVSAKELLYDWVRTLERIREFCGANPELSTPPGFSL
ncbi:isochorismatase family protein [Microbacterium sp. NIBRBAC000506063]|uniref:isochorismatase family protein n=1 Tax=Microbacterium sp. NIBRBAC000506063 TaxID=2734618 RepID=UPI001BB7E3A4|nr:isochorismatase family protein [Microbacterium sp. NIBRBAC000506063]QTV79590.1 isochorismatase family protein [Microbacterium sp. NIBRBAC000506063]